MKRFQLFKAKDENGMYTITFFKETLQSYLNRGGLIKVLSARLSPNGEKTDITIRYKRKIK